MVITIEYRASKSIKGGYKPDIYFNGKWCYTTTRNAKTERGALNRAKKMAEEMAEEYQYNNNNQVTVKVRV